MSKSNILPKPGDRCGFVYGPGGFPPSDYAGTVLCVGSDAWYTDVATVLMDDGTTKTVIGAYADKGIGCHLISAYALPEIAAKVSVFFSLESGGSVVHVFTVSARQPFEWFRRHADEIAAKLFPTGGYVALNVEAAT